MMTPEVAQLIASDRSAQLHRAAATARLAAIARCCRPGAVARLAGSAAAAVARLRTSPRRGRTAGAVCCAGA